MRLNATLLYYCFGKTSFGTSVRHHSTHSGCRISGREPGELHMREFLDSDGDGWVATVRSEEGLDFKGRHYLYFHPAGAENDGLELLDVRWNSPETAERTLATMSGPTPGSEAPLCMANLGVFDFFVNFLRGTKGILGWQWQCGITYFEGA